MLERVSTKVEKTSDLIESITKDPPKSRPNMKAALKFVKASTVFEKLRAGLQAAVADMTVVEGPEISMVKAETGIVVAGFEKDLDAVHKKLEDLGRERNGS